MIDWLTLRTTEVRARDLEKLHGAFGWRLEISPDGEIVWQKPQRKSVRSDSHQVTVFCGYVYDRAGKGARLGVELYGSPARVHGTNNVFGSSDPRACALSMIRYVNDTLGVELPENVLVWECSRMDVTENYDLGSAAEVRQALAYLRQVEGGRYQVRTCSETVYFNAASALRGAKAYHKGPHLRHQVAKSQAAASDLEVEAADRLLRLELSLRSQFWRERSAPWYELSEAHLASMHIDYFGKFIGKMEVVEMGTLLQQFERHAATKGQALSAYRTWSLIRAVGAREAAASMPRRTWYRHQRIMVAAGLTHADLVAGNVVPFRRRMIELGRPVRSWEELLSRGDRAAA